MSPTNTTARWVPRERPVPAGMPGALGGAARTFGQMPRRSATVRWVPRQVQKGKPGGSGPADRLSALPDALLHHVMSFLKAWEAVRTCVLSRRWRNLWASAPCVDLRLRCCGHDSCPPEEFGKFVYRLLLAREVSAPVDTLRLRSNEGDDYADTYDNDDVNMWIYSAIKRSARVIHLNGHRKDDLVLEHTAFVSRHLKILKLSHVKLDDGKVLKQISSRCTSLEDLELNNCLVNGHEIMSVSLKKLTMVKCSITMDLSVCAPNLELLCCITPYHRVPLFKNLGLLVSATIMLDDSFLRDDGFLHIDEEFEETSDDEDDGKTRSGYCDSKRGTESDTYDDDDYDDDDLLCEEYLNGRHGNLVDDFDYGSDIDSDDNTYKYTEIPNESRGGKYGYCNDSKQCSGYHEGEANYSMKDDNTFSGQNVLRSLSNTRKLELLAHSGEVVLLRELKRCLTFDNLKTLFLGEWCMAADFNALIFLLQHSPYLERLFLKLELNYSNKEPLNVDVKPKGRSFACKNLAVVNIKCSKDDGRVHMLAELFGANGLPLEKIYVRRTGSTYLRNMKIMREFARDELIDAGEYWW